MSRIKIVLLACTLALLFSGCVENSAVFEKNTATLKENTINADSVRGYDIASANNAFAFDMYSQMTQQVTGDYENILFSPYSISAAMAICYEGAENTTKEQISNVFYFPTNKALLIKYS